jgi:hypothetical protein
MWFPKTLLTDESLRARLRELLKLRTERRLSWLILEPRFAASCSVLGRLTR